MVSWLWIDIVFLFFVSKIFLKSVLETEYGACGTLAFLYGILTKCIENSIVLL
jgi:hypothetical protein